MVRQPSRPILEWAEKRADALRRAQLLRHNNLDPSTRDAVKPPIVWRTPPPPMTRGTGAAQLLTGMQGSQSAAALLELSFRSTPSRRSPMSVGTKIGPEGSASEEQLRGELLKTGRVLTGAQKQLVEEREANAVLVQKANDEVAFAMKALRDRDGHTAAIEAELSQLMQNQEVAIASERAKLANMLAKQRQMLQDEMVKAKSEGEDRFERQRQQQQALEEERHALKREVNSLRSQLEAMSQSQKNEAEAAHRLAEQALLTRDDTVARLHRKAARRLGQQGLTRGFNAWLDAYCWHRRAMNLLQRAGSRFSRPKIVAAFEEWWSVCEEVHRRGKLADLETEFRAECQKRAALEKEIQRVHAQHRVQVAAEVEKAVAAHVAEHKDAERREAEEAARFKAEMQERKRAAKATQLNEQAIRRLSKQAVMKGFNTWADAYWVAIRSRTLLSRAGARLRKPKLASAFYEWWAIREEEVKLRAAREKQHLLEKLEAASKANSEQLQALAEMTREERVAQLHRMAIRRIGKQGLTRGFNAWLETFHENVRTKQLLQHAGARLRKPKLAASFYEWWAIREEEVKLRAAREKQHLLEKLEAASKANSEQLQALAEMTREERVAQLHRMAIRRIGKQGLTRGFNAWLETFHENVRTKQLLQHAGARLRKPKLAASFYEWWAVREEAQSERLRLAHESQLLSHAAQSAALEKEMQRIRASADMEMTRAREEWEASLDAERRAAAKEKAEMVRQLEGYKRSQEADAEEQLRLLMETSREERVAQLHRMAVRRLGKQELSRGFNAWLDEYLGRAHAMALLHRASARLSKPRMAAAYLAWRSDYDHARLAVDGQNLEALRQEMEDTKTRFYELREKDRLLALKDTERARDEWEASLDAERRAAAKEKAEMVRQLEGYKRSQEADAEEQLRLLMETSREERVAQLHRMAVRRLGKQELSRGFNAWLEQSLERQHNRRLLQQAAARLHKPRLVAAYTTWWAQYNTERRRTEHIAQKGKYAELEEQMEQLRNELEATHRKELSIAAAEMERVRSEYEDAIAAEAAKSASLKEELNHTLAGGQEALKAATARVENMKLLETQLHKAREDLQQMSHDLALERTAVADERRSNIEITRELEQIRGAAGGMKGTDQRIKEAEERSRLAEQSMKEARNAMARLSKSEADIKRGSELKLAALLANQRAGFEESLKLVRLESDEKVRPVQT